MNLQTAGDFDGLKKNGEKFRFLIVDDSPFILRQMERFLEEIHCEVAGTASNGAEAIKAYLKVKPDVVTMDVTMPEMDGMEALAELLKLDPKARVIMVSAHGNENVVRESITRGATHFILKPLTLSKIRETLVPILEKIA
ncbi:MAG: response regulator [Candidatus Wallbacteria bacterium]|nr:response regulator [Candidatus Wallbacteria bacterium]